MPPSDPSKSMFTVSTVVTVPQAETSTIRSVPETKMLCCSLSAAVTETR